MKIQCTAMKLVRVLFRGIGSILFLLSFLVSANGAQTEYQPTWESLDQRPVAEWWRDAKFGVYLHWTLASVPAWGTHSSFYWPNLLKSRQEEAAGPKPRRNRLSDEHLGLWQFHVRNYGAEFQYSDFAPLFRAELFIPTSGPTCSFAPGRATWS